MGDALSDSKFSTPKTLVKLYQETDENMRKFLNNEIDEYKEYFYPSIIKIIAEKIFENDPQIKLLENQIEAIKNSICNTSAITKDT